MARPSPCSKEVSRAWLRWLLVAASMTAMAACQPFVEGLRAGSAGGRLTSAEGPDTDRGSRLDWGLSESTEDDDTSDGKDPAPTNNHKTPSRRAQYVLMGVDCFGVSGKNTCDTFSRLAGLDQGMSLSMGWTGGDAATRIRDAGAFSLVSLSPVFYPDGSAYVTIDVIPKDQRPRLSLRSPPGDDVEMPSNLIDVYAQFSQAWYALFSKGIEVQSKPRAGHWEYSHASLHPFVKLFRSEVPRTRRSLIKVLIYDAAPQRRQAAAGLLGFDIDDLAVADALTVALFDPEPTVRAAAARALLPKVRRASPDGRPLVAPQAVLHMLSLPTASDRSGASALLAELARIPELRDSILRDAAPILLKMVAARAPGSRGSAVEVLETATGLRFGDDVARWQKVLLDG